MTSASRIGLHLTIGAWLLVLPCWLSSGCRSAAQVDDKSSLSFKVLTGAETGLKAIMEKWKEDELKRQGKFGSHGWWPWGLAAFDYDNDGILDLVVQQHGVPGCIILHGSRDKDALTFKNTTAELGLAPAALASAFKPHILDVDGDGRLDLIVNGSPSFVNKDGKKFEPLKFTLDQLADWHVDGVNADGYPEAHSVRNGLRYSYDPKTSSLQKSAYLPPLFARPPECIAAFLEETKKANRFMSIRFFEGQDLSGDGIPDLVAAGFASYGGAVFGRYLLADKDGKHADRSRALGLPDVGTPILVLDLTGDGAAEVLVAAGPKAGLYLNDGKGKFTLQEGDLQKFLANRGPYLHKVSAVDLDNDGLPDLVLSNPRLGQEEIYHNKGGGKFQRVVQAKGWDADPIAIADFNDDGLLDVAIGGPGDTITLYLNQTAKPGHSCRLLPRMDRPNPCAVGTRLEVFKAGDLAKPNARPLWVEKANADGAPIHVGLGTAERFDLRATFPGKTPRTVELPNVEARGKIKVTPEGKAEEVR